MARETLSGEARKDRKKDKLQTQVNREYRALAEVIVSHANKGDYSAVSNPTEPAEVNGMQVFARPAISVSEGRILFDQSPIAIADASGKKRTIVTLKEDKTGNVTMLGENDRPVVRRRKSHPRGTVSKVSFKAAARETIILARGIRKELARQPQREPAAARSYN